MADDDMKPQRFYHGTKADLSPGDVIRPDLPDASGERSHETAYVHLTSTVDAAAWEAELSRGEGPGRIYVVEPAGPVMTDPDGADKPYPRAATESLRSRDPLRVTGECTDRQGRPLRLYHGTKADLAPGDLIGPGRSPNFGRLDRTTTYVYLAGTLDAAIWGAELAIGEGPGRIYVVEPTGQLMDDPNLTDQRFPGNPSKSYRSRESLRIVDEVGDWQGHTPEAIKAIKDGIEELRRRGVEPLD
jgi:rifampin ADP-ribosylating transferase